VGARDGRGDGVGAGGVASEDAVGVGRDGTTDAAGDGGEDAGDGALVGEHATTRRITSQAVMRLGCRSLIARSSMPTPHCTRFTRILVAVPR